MHIIATAKELTSSRGGLEKVLFDVCQGLSQRGHDITIVYKKEGNLLEKYQSFCTNAISYNRHSRGTSIFDLLADIWKIPGGKNAIVYNSQHHDIFFSYILALSKSVPLVSHLHLPPSELCHRRKIKIGLRGVKQFIAVSNQTKLDWVKFGYSGKKIEVINNGINLERFQSFNSFLEMRKQKGISQETKVIAYVGRIDKVKGIETLIEAFALLLEGGNEAKLMIAGRPVHDGEEYQQYLEKLAISLGVKKHIDFLGHLANPVSLYQASDVIVLPSMWSEPFPLTVIESMACGTPVVASRIGGIPENLTGEFEKGLVEPGDAEDLCKTLKTFVNWREQNPQLGERCRKHTYINFSMEKMIDRIEKRLLEVVEGNRLVHN